MTPDARTRTSPPVDATREQSDDAPHDDSLGTVGGDGTHLRPPAAEPSAGTVIDGKYKLTEVVGEGGMGSVWVANQTEPVRRKVAVKLIKAGMDSKQVLARFDMERQALAVMDHPNIAKVLDGGLHDGRPYFVMELVKGVPITQFCDEQKRTPQQRLELFEPVCQAIQHAHQKGVIHRDIKPSNVLVALYDDKPVVKVIDFGVAKATGAALTEHTLDTGFGAVVGTPAYMSPEQASLTNLDIDTRSDVYALGVLLYELLTGSPPFSGKELQKKGMLEMLRVVREEEPPRPSTKLSTADALPTLSANRGTEPKKLTGLLRNELDWIVMKALEKDRTRRYDTANGFAADVLRYLTGEPVLAHPPGAGYRLKKFVRRNRVQVIAAGGVLLALVGGVVGTTMGLVEADKHRKTAEKNLGTAEENFRLAEANQKVSEENYQLARGAVDRYLTQVGDNRLLNEPHMDDLRLELLGSAREFYQTFADRRRDDPSAAQDLAAARLKLADIGWRVGDHTKAIEELETGRTAWLASAPAGRGDLTYVRSGMRLASYHMQLGNLDLAHETANRALEDAEAGLRGRPDDAALDNSRASLYELRGTIHRRQNHPPLAVADYDQADEILRGLIRRSPAVREYPRDLSNVHVHRAQLAFEAGQDATAEAWFNKALEIRRRLVGEAPASVDARAGLAVVLSNLGGLLRRMNRHADGIRALDEAVAITRGLVRDHPGVVGHQSDLAGCLSNLSVVHMTSGDVARADALNAESLGILGEIVARHPTVSEYRVRLGTAEGTEGNSRLNAKKWDEALVLFDRSTTTLLPLLKKSDDPRVRTVLRNNHWGRADALAAKGDFAAAVSAFERAIEMAEERIRPELRLARALALAKSGDHPQARAAAEAALARESAKKHHWFDAAKVFAAAAAAAKGSPKAAELQARAVAALRTAFEKGYFATATSPPELRATDFDPLRERDDFKKLIADLEAKFPPKKETPPPPEKK